MALVARLSSILLLVPVLGATAGSPGVAVTADPNELLSQATAADDECNAAEGRWDEDCHLKLLQVRARRGQQPTGAATDNAPQEQAAANKSPPLPAALGTRRARQIPGQGRPEVPPLCTWMPWMPNCYVPKHIGGVMTLYHQTSTTVGPLILKTGFKPGHVGLCGGAIYFASNPMATYTKALGPDSHQGFIIEAKVDMGRVLHHPSPCDHHMTGEKLKQKGYDSIAFNPGDGEEFVIYSGSRVKSMRHFPR